MAKQPYIPESIRERMELGKAGHLWTIEVLYNVKSTTVTERKRNMKGEEIMQFRKNIFLVGMLINQAPGHWRVICPMDIVQVDLYRQSDYFPDAI